MLKNLNLLGYRIRLLISARKIRTKEVCGYTNRTKDGMYVLFLDYDRLELELVVDELKRLQMDFELGDFYIFGSSEDSYHAVCLDKLYFRELVRILNHTTIDENFLKVPLFFGKKVWTLRLTDKRVPIQFIRSVVNHSPVTLARQQSQAHANILEQLFKIPIAIKDSDKLEKVMLARYKV